MLYEVITSADRCHVGNIVFIDDAFQGCHAWQRARYAQLEQIIRQQPTAAATAKSALADGLGGHIVKMIAACLDDFARDFELAAGCAPHT